MACGTKLLLPMGSFERLERNLQVRMIVLERIFGVMYFSSSLYMAYAYKSHKNKNFPPFFSPNFDCLTRVQPIVWLYCLKLCGLKKNYSSTLTLIHLHDKISLALDRDGFAIGVFVDLWKVGYYSIHRLALKWITSYFSNILKFSCRLQWSCLLTLWRSASFHLGSSAMYQ